MHHRRGGAIGRDRTMSDRPITPAIAGAAQVVRRQHEDLETTTGPIELMIEAARRAADDAGPQRALDRVGWIGVAGGFWRYQDPGQLVAEAIGRPRAGTALTSISGSAPQELVGRAAELIANGDVDVALVLGGEARWTAERLRRAKAEPHWLTTPGAGQPELLSGFPDDDDVMREFRMFGAAAPAYALMDDSLRAAMAESVEAHRDRIAELWARFSAVAAMNPFAWDRTAHPAAEIRDVTPDNRMIAFPYPKAMVANNTVDMASAILLCSVDIANELGIPAERLVFPHAVTKAHETWRVVNRDELHGSPALTGAGHRALELAGIDVADVEHVDLYACFPAVVQMSARALGLDTARPLTVTGGLGFAGAPVGNAAGQSIAAMVPLVRSGGWGVVHGNGGNATKHAFGVYASHPPRAFTFEDCQARVDLRPRAALADDWTGPATVEAATVVFTRDGPSHVLAAVRPDQVAGGPRGWVTSRDPGLIAQVISGGLAGSRVTRTAAGEIA
jgi:acetyl-CoA C-acetyltransferase